MMGYYPSLSESADEQARPCATIDGLVSACGAEADRLVVSLKALDLALANSLTGITPSIEVLQSVDLICQEAAGLAAVLRLITKNMSHDRVLDRDTVEKALTLRAQRLRFQTVADRPAVAGEPP